MAEVYCYCFKRTRHASHPLPHKKHSRRYPHHYQHQPDHPPRGSSCYYTTSSNLSKFLILLFLSICDNRACRTHVEAAAAAEVYSSSSGSQLTSSSSSSSFSNVVYRDDSQVESASAASGSSAVNRTRLQEIVMEGLGLSAIPDVRAVSSTPAKLRNGY